VENITAHFINSEIKIQKNEKVNREAIQRTKLYKQLILHLSLDNSNSFPWQREIYMKRESEKLIWNEMLKTEN